MYYVYIVYVYIHTPYTILYYYMRRMRKALAASAAAAAEPSQYGKRGCGRSGAGARHCNRAVPPPPAAVHRRPQATPFARRRRRQKSTSSMPIGSGGHITAKARPKHSSPSEVPSLLTRTFGARGELWWSKGVAEKKCTSPRRLPSRSVNNI